ncbi:MAG: tetratricopeptide repeat protein [Flavitalea sp.]
MNKIVHTIFFLLFFIIEGCRNQNNVPTQADINNIGIIKGALISCGPTEKQFGSATFATTCNKEVTDDFNLGIQLLHSFEYNEAEKAFAMVVNKQPDCAMAYWGIAMANFHPLWTPPSESELQKGSKAINLAKSIKTSKKEYDYINAISSFYDDWNITDHRTRCLKFEQSMEEIYTDYPDDKEGAVLYALALCAAADPNDKTFSKQKKAGNILNSLYPDQPDHPGIVHYLIHAYDYPELAKEGLDAARKYASIAPSSAHALHMPSHIFTRLGLWNDCIQSNIESVSSAQCYAEAAGIKGHWDEELHGLDYLMYAYLQKGENDSAKKQWDYLKTITEVSPVNFKVAYAYAAIPSRYLLENKMWDEASKLEFFPDKFAWDKYPWQKAIIHFTRLYGSVQINDITTAKEELEKLQVIHDTLIKQKDNYKANQVAIQINAGEAWIYLKEGEKDKALERMLIAAEMEDKTEKHPVTPGEVIPARELLGNMYLELNNPATALEAFELDLAKRPNRFNGLYGAALSAKHCGNQEKAIKYYNQLISIVGKNSGRPELKEERSILENSY